MICRICGSYKTQRLQIKEPFHIVKLAKGEIWKEQIVDIVRCTVCGNEEIVNVRIAERHVSHDWKREAMNL